MPAILKIFPVWCDLVLDFEGTLYTMKNVLYRWIEIKSISKRYIFNSVGLMSLMISGMILLSGCATIINGSKQNIPVTSEPPGARITTNDGLSIITPGKLNLVRKKNYALTAKHHRFETQYVRLYKDASKGVAIASGVLTPGIGQIIDKISGGTLELVPKKVHFDFKNPKLSTVEKPRLVELWAKERVKKAAKSKIKAENSVKSANNKLSQAENNVEKAERELLKKENPKTQQKLRSALEKLAVKKEKAEESQRSMDFANWRFEQTKKILVISKEAKIAIESKLKADEFAKSEAEKVLKAKKNFRTAENKAFKKSNEKSRQGLARAFRELDEKRRSEEDAKKQMECAYKEMGGIRKKLKAAEDLLISKEAWFD